MDPVEVVGRIRATAQAFFSRNECNVAIDQLKELRDRYLHAEETGLGWIPLAPKDMVPSENYIIGYDIVHEDPRFAAYLNLKLWLVFVYSAQRQAYKATPSWKTLWMLDSRKSFARAFGMSDSAEFRARKPYTMSSKQTIFSLSEGARSDELRKLLLPAEYEFYEIHDTYLGMGEEGRKEYEQKDKETQAAMCTRYHFHAMSVLAQHAVSKDSSFSDDELQRAMEPLQVPLFGAHTIRDKSSGKWLPMLYYREVATMTSPAFLGSHLPFLVHCFDNKGTVEELGTTVMCPLIGLHTFMYGLQPYVRKRLYQRNTVFVAKGLEPSPFERIPLITIEDIAFLIPHDQQDGLCYYALLSKEHMLKNAKSFQYELADDGTIVFRASKEWFGINTTFRPYNRLLHLNPVYSFMHYSSDSIGAVTLVHRKERLDDVPHNLCHFINDTYATAVDVGFKPNDVTLDISPLQYALNAWRFEGGDQEIDEQNKFTVAEARYFAELYEFFKNPSSENFIQVFNVNKDMIRLPKIMDLLDKVTDGCILRGVVFKENPTKIIWAHGNVDFNAYLKACASARKMTATLNDAKWLASQILDEHIISPGDYDILSNLLKDLGAIRQDVANYMTSNDLNRFTEEYQEISKKYQQTIKTQAIIKNLQSTDLYDVLMIYMRNFISIYTTGTYDEKEIATYNPQTYHEYVYILYPNHSWWFGLFRWWTNFFQNRTSFREHSIYPIEEGFPLATRVSRGLHNSDKTQDFDKKVIEAVFAYTKFHLEAIKPQGSRRSIRFLTLYINLGRYKRHYYDIINNRTVTAPEEYNNYMQEYIHNLPRRPPTRELIIEIIDTYTHGISQDAHSDITYAIGQVYSVFQQRQIIEAIDSRHVLYDSDDDM